MTTIQAIEENSCVVGWSVSLEENGLIRECQVMVSDLLVPSFPTDNQILHVARRSFATPNPVGKIKRKLTERTVWTAAHRASRAAAVQLSLDVDKIVELLPDALELLLTEWESRELAKREARRITGLTARDCAKIEEEYRDYSTVPHFDEHCQELAMSHPELGWNSWEDNGQAMFQLLSEPNKRKPGRFSPEVVERAAEIVAHNCRSSFEFSEWVGPLPADIVESEVVPF